MLCVITGNVSQRAQRVCLDVLAAVSICTLCKELVLCTVMGNSLERAEVSAGDFVYLLLQKWQSVLKIQVHALKML